MTSRWGKITWTFIHTFLAQIKDEHFTSVFQDVFSIIRDICIHLPCPECANHAKIFFERIKPFQIKTRLHFVYLMYDMHNIVNTRLKKPRFLFPNMQYYRTLSIGTTCNNFLKQYTTVGTLQLMTDEAQRVRIRKMVYEWIKKHEYIFNSPINDIKPRE